MTDMLCGLPNRDELLVTYLYDDPHDTGRSVFEAHLAICARCRTELAALRGVRTQLSQWEPSSVISHQSSVVSPQSLLGSQSPVGSRSPVGPQPSVNPQSSVVPFVPASTSTTVQPPAANAWWREVPAWAQIAAAVVCLGVGAGLANLNIRYDQQGLIVRTGWLSPAPVAAPPQTPISTTTANTTPWLADLTALERQLREEFRAAQPAAASTMVRATQPSMSETEMMRRVRAIVEESERKQERELALRVGQVIRDVNAQRQADLRKIDSNLGFIQSNTGAEVMKQRQLLMNYLVRASSQK